MQGLTHSKRYVKSGIRAPAPPLVEVRVEWSAHKSLVSEQFGNLLCWEPETRKTKEILQKKVSEAGVLDLRHSDRSLHGFLDFISSGEAVKD